MSAWYLLSALEFYPISPGSLLYDLGSPLVKNAKLTLENGKTFEVVATNQSEHNVYVQSVYLNGSRIDRTYITYDEIINGGKIEFVLSSIAKK